MASPHRPVPAILHPNRLCRHGRLMLQSRKSIARGMHHAMMRSDFV
jgi:hypothetical protein